MIKEYPKSVSEELHFTKVNKSDYVVPTEGAELVKCVLNCRYWGNANKTIFCVLLLTTFDNRKIKLPVFKKRSTGNYNPTSQIKENFCVRNNLNLNDVIYITYSKSEKGNNIYLREVHF